MSGTVGAILERNARLFGKRIGYSDGARQLSHAEYLARCRAIAGNFAASGARRQDRIAVLSRNNLEYLELYGACEVSRLTLATLNFRLSEAELARLIDDIAPVALVFEAAYAETVETLRPGLGKARLFAIGEAPAWARPYHELLMPGHDAEAAGEDDIAHLIYTSGSTGRPKGCMLGQKELARKFANHAADLAMTDADRLLIMMPLFHVGARGVIGAGQWRGAAIHLQQSFEPEDVIDAIARERITVTHMAPTMVQALLDHPGVGKADMSSLRALYYAAAPMPLPVLRRGLELLGPVFHQSYGQTEGYVTALLRHQHRIDGSPAALRKLASVGQPCPGVDVRLVDDLGADVAPGQAGEIVYRGGTVFRGYWNNHAATLETLRDGWVHSGDIGTFDEDGFLYIVDRKKDMIISGGENIYCREVEEALLSHPDIVEAAVVGVPHEKWGETVHAVIVRRGESGLDADSVIAHSRANLASYKKPTGVTFLAEIPRLSTGKHDKVAIRSLLASTLAPPNRA